MNIGFWTINIGGEDFADLTDVATPLSAGGGPAIMEFPAYGAATPVFLNLGNAKNGLVFDVTLNFATDTLAASFYMTGIATWAGVATVILTHLDYSGTTTTWTIANAKVELDIQQPIGPCIQCKLTITGGVPVT